MRYISDPMASRYATEGISLVAFSIFGAISADILAYGSAGIVYRLGITGSHVKFLEDVLNCGSD